MFDSLDHRFTKFLLESNALKFGDFTLKSGRQSPYFINAGAFDDGKKIATLGGFYAEKIQTEIDNEQLPIRIDTIFGPAYKGIPLAVATSIALELNYGVTVGYTFDRKEKKDHGDGGTMVGKPLEDGMNVLLVDDVMTAGTAVREVVPKLRRRPTSTSSASCCPWTVWRRRRIPTCPPCRTCSANSGSPCSRSRTSRRSSPPAASSPPPKAPRM